MAIRSRDPRHGLLRDRVRPGLLVAVLALVAAACGPAAATPSPASPTPAGSVLPSVTPAPSATASCEAGAGPAGTPTPIADPAAAARYDEIEAQVTELRGLERSGPVARGAFDVPALCAFLLAAFAEENPPELVEATERFLVELLLLPEDADLARLYLDLLTSQVAGLYDDDARTIYVVAADGELGVAEAVTYAHEYVHALQDQVFGLRRFVGEEVDEGDRLLARTAVVEGDATLVMTLWSQRWLSRDELLELASSTDPAAQAVLERTPRILVEPLLFPYTRGLDFAFREYQDGGVTALDALYEAPPATTEQILHPAKWDAREPAIPVVLPADLAVRLGGGWSVDLEDTLGEYQLGLVLRESGAPDPGSAAAGWGGDRTALVRGPGGELGIVLATAWDSAGDADEFTAALGALVDRLRASGRAAAVLEPQPGRVVLVTGSDASVLERVANALGLAG